MIRSARLVLRPSEAGDLDHLRAAVSPYAAAMPGDVVGPLLHLPGGVEARIHVGGQQTGGAFVLLTDAAPPGWSLPPHRHANESETIHITSGALWLDVDGHRRELRAGETAHIAPRALHSGGTLGEEVVRRVVIFSPAGMEHFFQALAATTEPAAMLRLATEHGWRFSEPRATRPRRG